MRYEAGANGYRIVPITKEEFAIMMTAASRPKNGETNKFVSASKHHQPQPQPIFPKSKEENRSPTLSGSRAEDKLHPKSVVPSTTLKSGKKLHGFANSPVSKEEGGASRKKNSSLEEKAPPIIPAFLRPKVSNYRNCRLYCSEELCDTNLSLLRYGITDFW